VSNLVIHANMHVSLHASVYMHAQIKSQIHWPNSNIHSAIRSMILTGLPPSSFRCLKTFLFPRGCHDHESAFE